MTHFVCQYCNATFFNPSTTCPVCGKLFGNWKRLSHYRIANWIMFLSLVAIPMAVFFAPIPVISEIPTNQKWGPAVAISLVGMLVVWALSMVLLAIFDWRKRP